MTKIQKANHEKELSERLLARIKTGITVQEALEKLSVQELIAVWERSRKELEKENISEDDRKKINKGIRIIEKRIPVRLASQQKVYTLFDEFRHMPYFMPNCYVCLFTEREYAQQMSDRLAAYRRTVRVSSLEKAHLRAFYEQQFSLYGAKGIIIDVGQNAMAFPPDHFISEKDYKVYDPKNPDLVRSLSMLQQEVKFGGDANVIAQLRSESVKYLSTAKFIMPLPFRAGKPNYLEVVKPGTKSPLAVPVFTDLAQYNIFYTNTTFQKRIMTVGDLSKIPPQLFTVNPGTLWFPVDKETLKKL
ncbi:MAG: hypothetical protein IJI14_19995 [Anaerolineaceae bacterium]|nr:hypothetical protein [Anaerolineaceae bacterium]